MTRITPELLLHAYARGFFPMAESADSTDLFWVDPDQRGIIPLDGFHLPHRLARLVRQDRFRVTLDMSFREVMRMCAGGGGARDNTWINDEILSLYGKLHDMGFAHSVECWQDEDLVGGLYGVSLGAAFFGESMFHHVRDASKVALVHLVARLKYGGYRLLDSQFVTDHLAQFGAQEVSREDYHGLLAEALSSEGDFFALSPSASGASVVQFSTQTS